MRIVGFFVVLVPLFGDPGGDYFETNVRPLLAAKCYGRLSRKLASPMGGLRLDDPRVVRSLVQPNQADASRMIPAVRYQSIGMPPGGKLKDDQIATLVKWVVAREVVRKAAAARLPFLTVRGLTDLGNAQLAKLDLPAAEATLREAVRLAVDDKLPRGQATARLSLGSVLLQESSVLLQESSVLLQENRYAEAEPELKAALDFFTRGQFEDEISVSQTLLARVYRSRGDFVQMHRILADQLKSAEAASNPAKVIAVLGEIANGYSSQERYPEALTAFERRFTLAKDRGVPADSRHEIWARRLAISSTSSGSKLMQPVRLSN